MPTALNTPIVEGGLDRIPFFNGRVLTAEDLKTEQTANATERKRLGRALGTGVIEGLFVDRVDRESDDFPTTVTVESGLALAPSGCIVELPQTTDVSVVSEIDRDETAGTKGRFASCSAREVVATSGTGAYLLFVEPAAKPEGRTTRSRLGGDGMASECGAKYRRKGARLCLVPLDTGDTDLVPGSLQDEQGRKLKIEDKLNESDAFEAQKVSKLRNILAHVCLRTPSALAETASLYDTLRRHSQGNEPNPDGPVDVLRDRAAEENDGLDDAVPLGLLYWSSDRIEFVDVWSVRRRVHRPDPQQPLPATARRRAETEAAIYQFQDHVADLEQDLSPSAMASVSAKAHFAILPPVGILPEQADGQPGFNLLSFFEGMTVRDPVFIDGTRLTTLFRSARGHSSRRILDGEFWWLYRIRQNRSGEFTGSQTDEDTAYLAFASGFLPHVGEAQFDLARWNYGNYGPAIDRNP